MNYLPIIKALLLSVALIVPTLHGMLEVTTTSEELPVQLRHRGYTPLHVAAYLGNREQIVSLLTDGACVDARSVSGHTPLHIAAQQGHVSVVEALITELEKIKSFACPLANQALATPSLVDIRDNSDVTPLACAASNGHIDVIRCLIAHGANISLADKRGKLPFHRATQIGHLEAMEILQPKDEPSNEHNLRVLHRAIPCAIESGKPEALASVKRMIEERRGPGTESGTKWYNWYNYHGATPFLDAAASGHVSMMHWSLEHDDARIDERDSDGNCALHFAARYGHTDAVEFLLERNAELVKIKNGTQICPGRTALHDAAAGGHLEVIKLLLHYKAEVDAQDSMGWTPLHRAAYYGRTQALQQLISFGASPSIANERGNTALHLAALHGHRACVEVLLAAKSDIEAKTPGNLTPLLCAAECGHLELIKCLLPHGADIKQQAITGNALMLAVQGLPAERNDDVIRYLLDNTEVELMSCSNWCLGVVPVIFSAARNGHYKASSLLIKKGASLDTKLSDGRTVLHCAAENYQTSLHNSGVVRLLLRAGADMLCLDYAGLTPLDGLQLSQHQLPAATTYFQNRSLYLSGQLRPEDNLDTVFSVAADFLDIPVLEALKDQLGDRLIQWRDWTGDKNLLMVAITMHDLDGIDWLLDQKICDMSHKDINKHDVLSIAIDSTRSKNTTTRLSLINKLLAAGAVVTEQHLIDEANRSNSKVDELLMRLLVTYRYSQRPAHERLSLFR